MSETTETLLSKKLERSSYWNANNLTDNFAEVKELTVEITLAEYRELVEKNAVSKYKIDEANSDKYERNKEIEILKAKNKDLELIVFQYRSKYGDIEKPFEED